MAEVCYNISIESLRTISLQGRFSSPRKETIVEDINNNVGQSDQPDQREIILRLNPHQAFLLHAWVSDRFEWYMQEFFKAKNDIDKRIAQDFMLDALKINSQVTMTQPDLRITYRSLLKDFLNAVTKGEKPTWIQ